MDSSGTQLEGRRQIKCVLSRLSAVPPRRAHHSHSQHWCVPHLSVAKHVLDSTVHTYITHTYVLARMSSPSFMRRTHAVYHTAMYVFLPLMGYCSPHHHQPTTFQESINCFTNSLQHSLRPHVFSRLFIQLCFFKSILCPTKICLIAWTKITSEF